MLQGWRVDVTHGTQIIVVDVFLRSDKRTALINVGQGVDEIGIMVFEHHGGFVPLLHHKPMGNVQTIEYQVEHFDIVS